MAEPQVSSRGTAGIFLLGPWLPEVGSPRVLPLPGVKQDTQEAVVNKKSKLWPDVHSSQSGKTSECGSPACWLWDATQGNLFESKFPYPQDEFSVYLLGC